MPRPAPRRAAAPPAPVLHRRALVLAGAGLALGAAPARAQGADHAKFMRQAEAMRALALQRGDQGFGAVVVKDGAIVGEGPSEVVTRGDPTAHAEMQAIRDAARRLGTRDLFGCVLYATFTPCPMCATAAHWARISTVFVGAAIANTGAPRYGGC